MGHAARPTPRWRRISAVAPLVVAVAALPLMAPTCGTGTAGTKVFAKGSLVIPMDACYQNTPTTLTNTAYFTPYSGCPSNGTTTYDAGNAIRAYGLVYQLLRNNIPVYWVINPAKSPPGVSPNYLVDTANPDITLSLSGGPPVGKYLWATNAVGGMPANNTTSAISYHGGPFVVDGSDAAAAMAVMQSLKNTSTGALTFQSVNVHVANVAFTANVAKSMSGGFQSSGGSVPPPVALLNITGGDGKNSEVVTQGYLVDAGLGPTDFPGAGGTATPTGHGKIYDDLYPADFLPAACSASAPCANGSACTGGQCVPSLTYFGYSVLWVPHWCGNGSQGIPAGFTYTDILAAIRGYLNAGHDVMAECAGLGTFEGVSDGTVGCNGSTADYEAGSTHPPTQVQTTGGVNINEQSLVGAKYWGSYASPFLQLGDFPFTPVSGAIQQYSAYNNSAPYASGVVRLISDSTSTTKDYFTLLPAAGGLGTVVYLAGHDYSGAQGYSTQIGGSRLVLNTLFNLGNACVATGAACSTGKLGVCAAGTMQCVGGVPTCVQTTQPSPEVCDGLDNDCNGAVDDIPPQQFYDGSSGCTLSGGSYQCQGLCHPGVKTCVFPPPGVTPAPAPGTVVPLTATVAEVTPAPEICDGLDNDCNGLVDDGIPPRPCYDGAGACPPGVAGPCGCTQGAGGAWSCLGTCKTGTQSCTNGSFGACTGEVLPAPEMCEPLTDTNCNGIVGDGCGCVPGTTRVCYTGPAATENVGLCRSGVQTCDASGLWPGTCPNEVLPAAQACDGQDHDCDGIPDVQEMCCAGSPLAPATSRPCYTGSTGCTQNADGTFTCVGVCASGTEACAGSAWSGVCAGEVTPAPAELCNGKNDTCSSSWTTDDGVAACGLGMTCLSGNCVTSVCGVESYCPEGYQCSTTTSTCALASCGTTGAPCPVGQACKSGACVDPCTGPGAPACGPGSYCSGGVCVGGGCDATGCPASQICLGGTCQADPCAGLTCPSGTFCRGGYCVQSCYFVSCQVGQRCGPDGFCVTDPCASLSCGPGQVCQASGAAASCVADPCKGISCGTGQVCANGLCADDPCTGVACPVGSCLGGQCFSPSNPTGIGTASTTPGGGSGQTSPPPAGGCGCGGGDAGGALALLLGLLALPRRHRAGRGRPGGGPGPGALALLLALLASAGLACSSKSGGASDGGACVNKCGSICTDLQTDPAHCGDCAVACGSGDICVDGACGPGSAVAPYVTAVAPSAAPSGAPATLDITGQRFQPDAGVVALGLSVPVAAQFVDTGHLTAQIDLTSVPPAAAEIRVVNPDRVISNGVPFDVTVAAPLVSGLSPTSAATRVGQPPGTTQDIAVSGSGFVSSSQCRISGASFPEQGLVTTLSSGVLHCALDLSTTQPGAYSLWVVNAGVVKSNAATFTVTTTTPTLTAISPTGGAAGTVTSITATGSGFDATSVVQVDGAVPTGLTTTYVGATRVYAAPLDLSRLALGPHAVTVQNASGPPTAAQTFTVTAAAPTLTSVSPASVRQGATVTLTLTGTAFDAGTTIQVLTPGGGTATVAPATWNGTQLTASYTFASAGTYLLSVSSSAGSSGSLPVTSLSNVAILSGLSPANAQQGAKPTLTLTASNLDPGGSVQVRVAGAPAPGPLYAPTSLNLSAGTLTLALDLTGWPAATYAVTVVNQGAADSNGLGFTVVPGPPTVTAVSPTCAVQSTTPVAVTITGTNFASGASAVHAASSSCFSGGTATCEPTCLVPDYLVPAASVTVVSPTTIQVGFDTTQAVPDVYSISVWNPGPSVLKSNTDRTFKLAVPTACAPATGQPNLQTCP